jgi:hypothetical protein
VVKAADGMVRAPGSSGKQMRDYVGIQTQLMYDMGEGLFLPALSLLVDWQLDVDREPIVHLSLPIRHGVTGKPLSSIGGYRYLRVERCR